MSTITKKQAQEIIDAATQLVTALAGTNEDVHPDNCTKMVSLYDDLNDHYAPPEVVLALARIALASLEAELQRNPVLAYADSYRDMAKRGVASIPVWSVITDLERNIAPLFTAPPAPVVPDEKRDDDGSVTSDFDHGWNACRAAMLQAGNSPVIPDGYALVPVEPTEKMVIEGFESEPYESFSDEKEWDAYQKMSGCEQAAHRAKLCWAAMLAAAPQQEVK